MNFEDIANKHKDSALKTYHDIINNPEKIGVSAEKIATIKKYCDDLISATIDGGRQYSSDEVLELMKKLNDLSNAS
jgi:hypothetical protein